MTHDPRPVYKRGKFVAWFVACALFSGALVSNAITGSVPQDVLHVLAQMVAGGLLFLLGAQGGVDIARQIKGGGKDVDKE